ncbi:uncharacterized protein LOC133737758 [Rosa rugosa]|uniref:uncharacterized protein LOC133737758 n=1 Tax=Rosa rugosa TaxID=74645 RepID=UPI002B4079E2|nr:uncharacterized protein LOC133737758 [Rosa rugosa]
MGIGNYGVMVIGRNNHGVMLMNEEVVPRYKDRKPSCTGPPAQFGFNLGCCRASVRFSPSSTSAVAGPPNSGLESLSLCPATRLRLSSSPVSEFRLQARVELLKWVPGSISDFQLNLLLSVSELQRSSLQFLIFISSSAARPLRHDQLLPCWVIHSSHSTESRMLKRNCVNQRATNESLKRIKGDWNTALYSKRIKSETKLKSIGVSSSFKMFNFSMDSFLQAMGGNRGSADRDRGFERELEAMGDIKHRNIVTLNGWCART